MQGNRDEPTQPLPGLPAPLQKVLMAQRGNRPIRTGSDADLAFAVVVLAAYFTTFSTLRTATAFELLAMIALGVLYITLGIYGYGLVSRYAIPAWNVAYFVAQLAIGSGIIYLGKGAAFNAMVLLPLAGHSVVLMGRNGRAIVNMGIVAAYILAVNSLAGGWQQVWSGLPIFLGGQIFILAFTQMAVNEERARAEVELLVSDLAEANQNLRAYAAQVEELTLTKERNRLAREIHDGLGHYLTTIYMQIQAARAVMKVDEARAADALLKAQTLTQDALIDVRRSVSALREQPGPTLPVREEITKLLASCEANGLTTELKVLGTPRPLSAQQEWAVYRTVQEALHNTDKHAQAQSVFVVIDYTQSEVFRLAIQDDGRGAEELNNSGFGLLGMRERVHLLNGTAQFITSPGHGFRIEITLPQAAIKAPDAPAAADPGSTAPPART